MNFLWVKKFYKNLQRLVFREIHQSKRQQFQERQRGVLRAPPRRWVKSPRSTPSSRYSLRKRQ